MMFFTVTIEGEEELVNSDQVTRVRKDKRSGLADLYFGERKVATQSRYEEVADRITAFNAPVDMSVEDYAHWYERDEARNERRRDGWKKYLENNPRSPSAIEMMMFHDSPDLEVEYKEDGGGENEESTSAEVTPPTAAGKLRKKVKK